MTVNTLEIKRKARSLPLGVDLDGAVQEYIQSLRMPRGVVNTLVVIAASEPYRQMKITSISILSYRQILDAPIILCIQYFPATLNPEDCVQHL